MLNDTTRKELDQISEAVEKKINDRFDQIEIDSKKSNFNQNQTQRQTLHNFIQKGLNANKGNAQKFEFKAGELFTSEATGSIVAPQYAPGIHAAPFESDLRSFLPQSRTDSNTVVVNTSVLTNNADTVAEGATKPTSTNALTATSYTVGKYAHTFSVSSEFLSDVTGASQFISNQITGGLIEKINDNIITQILANDTAFSAGAFALGIESANEFDVLMVAINQLRLGNYNPDTIFLNPNDFVKMSLLKDTTNTYLRGTTGTSLQDNIQGVRILQSAAITSGDYHVMDSNRFGAWYTKENLRVEIGESGTDFIENQKTVLCESRGVLAVMDSGAAVTGDFTTDKAALETA
jgi:HK97 family phage major capsid protein